MWRKIGIALCLCGLSAGALSAGASAAEDASSAALRDELAELREELNAQKDLQRRMDELERRLNVYEGNGGKLLAGFDKGKFFLASEDDDFRLTFGGRIHFHGIFPTSGPSKNTDDLIIRRIRTVLQGRLARHYEFKIEYDFGRGKQALTDGYLNLAHIEEAQVRMGKFKVPFSVEELTSSNSIRFVERSIVSRAFAPSRKIGVAIHGKAGAFGYQAGVFDGSETGNFIYAGRATFDAGSGVTLGANAFHEHNRGADLNDTSYSTELATKFFRYAAGTVSDGSRTSYGFDISYWGTPLGLVAEYIASRQDASLGSDNRKLTNDGWLLQGSYVLTGENATAGGVTPKKNFDPANGGWGALELAARYAVLDADSSAFPTFATPASTDKATVQTAGLNWYLNRNFRVMLNYVYSEFDERVNGDKSEAGVLFRVQLAF